jgi:hypothetical protein
MSTPQPEPFEPEHHPIENAFTEEEMRLAGIYCCASAHQRWPYPRPLRYPGAFFPRYHSNVSFT